MSFDPIKLSVAASKGKAKKGRTFGCTLLAFIEGDRFIGADTEYDRFRPLFFSVVATEAESKYILASIRSGFELSEIRNHSSGKRFKLLKKYGYTHTKQKIEDSIVLTFYVASLFDIDPGLVDPDHVRFVMLPDQAWVDSQPEGVDAEALLFLSYLDRRIKYPFPPSDKFGRLLLDQCLVNRLATRSDHNTRYVTKYEEHGFENLNLPQGLGFDATQQQLGELLAETIQIWHQGEE